MHFIHLNIIQLIYLFFLRLFFPYTVLNVKFWKSKSLLLLCKRMLPVRQVLSITFLAHKILANLHWTNNLALEIYGSLKVELMFILNQIATHNLKWHIRACLLGCSKAGLHEPCTFVPDRKHARDCWACLTCQARRIFSLLCMHPYNLRRCAMTARFECPWFNLLSSYLSSCLFHDPSIKNAPRWLVKGRWEWRLGLFKDPSQLFKARFDSENGGGLISYAEVLKGMNSKCNARCWNWQKHQPQRNVCSVLSLTNSDFQSQHLFKRHKRKTEVSN